jgi:hypothetical protein
MLVIGEFLKGKFLKRKNDIKNESNREQQLLKETIFKTTGIIKSSILDTIKHNLYVVKRTQKN